MPLEFADEVPNYTEGRKLNQAFDLGWAMACRWAERRDLIDDIGSPAYMKARGELLDSEIP
ncbi:hypothetical protein Xoosp13_98 [Xanthomonas phage Xoo-sp13]|nr:hypothetical protein Xoosp13_98 [Xanthomonas phage Xoo-sp13]